MIEGDQARLKQVVVNLLDNAIKYTPNGGRVKLKISRERSDAVLDVADDGVGIPPKPCRTSSRVSSVSTAPARATRAARDSACRS